MGTIMYITRMLGILILFILEWGKEMSVVSFLFNGSTCFFIWTDMRVNKGF